MGDNIRLKGPLGLKQDVYDQARSEEWRKIIKIEDPQIRIKKLEEYFNIEPKKKMKGGVVKKALFGKMISSTATASPEGTPSSGNLQLSGLGKMFGNLPLGFFKPVNEIEKDKSINTDFFLNDEKGNKINIGKKDGGLIRQGFPKVAKKGWK